MSYIKCRVIDCRYKYSHATQGHMCGKCHKLGHGQVEHGNQRLIDDLKVFSNEELPVQCQCTVTGCTSKQYHKTSSHHCQICFGLHSATCCPLIIGQAPPLKDKVISEPPCMKIKCPICQVINKIPHNQKKIYGVSDRCCICKDDNAPAEVYFPQCGHVCACLSCCEHLGNQ